jgi:uncharacterized protein with PIN domain
MLNFFKVVVTGSVFMESLMPVFALVVTGIVLLIAVFILIYRKWSKQNLKRKKLSQLIKSGDGPFSGDGQVCPLCTSKLSKGDRLEAKAFPSVSGGQDRTMHIKGCVYCLSGNAERICPVCKASLGDNDIVVARMFERSEKRKSHVHILGCSQCRKVV